MEAAPGEVLSGDALRTVLPGGRYACLRFKGTDREINAAWSGLLSGWLPDSSLQLDARAMFEHYPVEATYDPVTGVFECNLCIPVSPL